MPEAEVRVGANVQSAEDAFRALAADAQKSLSEIGSEGEKVSARLAVLDKLWDSPARLGKAAALAKLDLENLSQSVEKAGVMTPKLAEAFEKASQKIDSAVSRARQFADTAQDLKEKGDASAKGVESLASRLGSLEGVLGLVKERGGAAGEQIERIGFSMIALNQGVSLAITTFKGLEQAGEALGQKLASVVDRMSALELKAAESSAHLAKIEQATRLAEKGVIEFGGSVAELEKNFDRYRTQIGLATQATGDLAGKLRDPQEVMEKLKTTADDLGDRLSAQFGKSKEAGLDWARANKGLIEDIIKQYKDLGQEAPKALTDAIAAIDRQTKARQQAADADKRFFEENKRLAQEAVAESQKAAEAEVKRYEDAAKAIDAYIASLQALESAQQAASNAATQHQQVVNDLSNAMVANGASGRGLADIHKAMADSITAGQEPVVRMQILQIQLTEATDAAIERLHAQATAFDEVVDKENMLVDYAANILSAYQSGFTDLFTTLEQIDNLIRQLNTMLMQNMGTKFAEEIQKMLDAYKQLRNEVATGLVKKDEKLKY